MKIAEIIRGLVSQQKKIDVKHLPSQGIFYPSDLEIVIKKADVSDIIEYEEHYDPENVYIVIENIKRVVRNNIKLNQKYTYEMIKSVDIVYLFLEVVKWTQCKEIKIAYFSDISGKVDFVNFGSKTFNYFDYTSLQKDYDTETREILLDDYRVSLPSIGIEDSLTRFLLDKTDDKDVNKWNTYSYDFLYFLGNKNKLTPDEIDNLVTIFNYDIDDTEKRKIKKIVKKFVDVIGYSIVKDGQVVEIKSKIDLSNIWKD